MQQSEGTMQPGKDDDYIEFRDGNLFIIDTSPEMFQTDDSHFEECLHAYGRILSHKLSWNKRDWMGLMLFNTKLHDGSSEMENIHTVQKFGEVTIDMLNQIHYILSNEIDRYKENALTSDASLHDVLWHACRAFDSIKISMSPRQVVLLTCRDNPLVDNTAERHKIRLRAQTYPDVNVTLQIIGLGQQWNHELFYKDIDVLANNFAPDDVKRMELHDLEVQVKFPARITGRLKLRIGDNTQLSTFVASFSSKGKSLKRIRMHKETNEVLELQRHWGTKSREFGDDSEDEGEEELMQNQITGRLRKSFRCGNKSVCFLPREVKQLRSPFARGINLLGFKPLSLDLVYHIKPVNFIGIQTSASKEEKEMFAALLVECETKNTMGICAVSHRAAPYLAKMISCPRFGGFYLYRIPFKEQVNDLNAYVKPYIYDTKKLPTDPEGVALMAKISKKIRMNWNPDRYMAPRLQVQMNYIETLALDYENARPVDSTLPDKTTIDSRLRNLVIAFESMFESTPKHIVKRSGTAGKTVKTAGKKIKLDEETTQRRTKH